MVTNDGAGISAGLRRRIGDGAPVARRDPDQAARLAPDFAAVAPYQSGLGPFPPEKGEADRQDSVKIGPLRIARLSREDFASRVLAFLASDAKARAFSFCNAHMAEIAFSNPDYCAALERFFVVNDGFGVDIAARLLDGRPFIDNLNGTDFLPYLFRRLRRPTRLYLLGAKAGVAEEAGRRLAKRFPRLIIVGARDGYFPPEREHDVVTEIADAAPDILLVALGNPNQEFFIVRHLEALNARATFGVGAFLDFTAGKVERAPTWVRQRKLEWMFRLIQEPKRLFRRYTIEMAQFLWALVKFRLAQNGANAGFSRQTFSAARENRLFPSRRHY